MIQNCAIAVTYALLGAASTALAADAVETGHTVAAPAAPSAAAPAAPARQAPIPAPTPAPKPTPVQPVQHAPTTPTPTATPQAQSPKQGKDHDHDGDHDGHRRNDQNNNTIIYGQDPFWGDNDWNNGNYNDVTYTPNAPAPDTGNNTAPSTPPPTASPSETSPSPAAAAAQAENAVDKSPEMIAANNDVQKAQAAYDTERERVLAGLNSKPEYQQAVARKHDAQHDLHAAQQAGSPTPAVVDAATAKLDSADEVTKMQEQAVATDSAASAAKQRLVEATADRDQLRAKLLEAAHH